MLQRRLADTLLLWLVQRRRNLMKTPSKFTRSPCEIKQQESRRQDCCLKEQNQIIIKICVLNLSFMTEFHKISIKDQ